MSRLNSSFSFTEGKFSKSDELLANISLNSFKNLLLETVLLHINDGRIAPGVTKITVGNCEIMTSISARFLDILID